MTKGEPILIEQVADGAFIVNPKEITNFTKLQEDIHAFETLDGLKRFIDGHFGGGNMK